ncbi:hypothetical protein [Actinoplanes sp. NPDC049118]|uniref:hypothetical protein n=1 Tax=Actinoplanes sp. NPDC049118 TaxID=3155769 RepID=UPI0033CE7508
MAGDDRKINLDLFARDNTKSGTDSAARNLDKYGKAADESAKRVEKLNRESDLLEREMESLARAFADTEDAAERADLSKGIRALEADLRKISKSKGILEGIIPEEPDEDTSKGFGRKLISNIGAGITDAGMSVATKAGASVGPVVGGAIAAAAAPLIASSLAGAIIGGAGIGGVVGGLMVARKDPRVAGEIKALSDGLKDRLTSAADGFVQPAIEGVGIIRKALDTINVEEIFADSKEYVVPLAEGVGTALEGLGDGLEDLVANAGPVIDSIADGIGKIGTEVGEGLSSLADNAESAADGLDTVFTSLGHLTDISFGTINGLMELNEQLQGTTLEAGAGLKAVNQLLSDGSGTLGHYKVGTDAAADGIGKVGEAATAAKDPLDTFIQQLHDSVEAGQSLYDSETDVAEALDKAREAAEKNGKTTDANTEKGRANREALSTLATQLRDNYTKYVELNGASGQANVVAEQNRQAFIRTATQFGKTKAEAEKLADEILGIPKTAGTRAVWEDTKAEKEMRAYIALLKKIPAHKRTVVETARIVTGSTGSSSALDSALRKNARAEGGPVRKGEAYLVGEKRAEVFVPDRDGQIIPSVQDYARGGRMGGSSPVAGVQTVRHVFDVTGAETKHLAWLREMFRTGQLP